MQLQAKRADRGAPGHRENGLTGTLGFLSFRHHGLRRIPGEVSDALGRVHETQLLKLRSRKDSRYFTDKIAVLVEPANGTATMDEFYDQEGFGHKKVGGTRVRVTPEGKWTDELKRRAIMHCIHRVLGYSDPNQAINTELRKHIAGIYRGFGQNKQRLIDFAYG